MGPCARERSEVFRTVDRRIGPFTGQVAEPFSFPEFENAVHDLNNRVHSPETPVLWQGRNRIVELSLPGPEGKPVPIAIKAFRRPPFFRHPIYVWKGSKARRAYHMAQRLVERDIGTPLPLGFLERWNRGRLVESYLLTEYRREWLNGRSELRRLFGGDPQYRAGTNLLRFLAHEIRRFHDAGFQHGDLGHQNILVRRTAHGWQDARFVDLNRVRIRNALSLLQRGREISQLWLPYSLRDIFLREYFSPQAPPAGVYFWEGFFRFIDLLYRVTRPFRHPVRTLGTYQRRRPGQRQSSLPQAKTL